MLITGYWWSMWSCHLSVTFRKSGTKRPQHRVAHQLMVSHLLLDGKCVGQLEVGLHAQLLNLTFSESLQPGSVVEIAWEALDHRSFMFDATSGNAVSGEGSGCCPAIILEVRGQVDAINGPQPCRHPLCSPWNPHNCIPWLSLGCASVRLVTAVSLQGHLLQHRGKTLQGRKRFAYLKSTNRQLIDVNL